MYMLTILQLEAYRATGDKKYLDRDAQEMVAYLDKLQQGTASFTTLPMFHFSGLEETAGSQPEWRKCCAIFRWIIRSGLASCAAIKR